MSPPMPDVLADLRRLSTAIRRGDDAQAARYAARLNLIRAARAQDPPVPYRAIADACGVSEVAIIKQIRKADHP